MGWPRRIWGYLWASPTTAIGLVVCLPHFCWGGKAKLVDGVLEVHGGLVRTMLRRGTVIRGGVSALTLGHVVLGQDLLLLELTRRHERVHVRQCERWGPLFLPAYLLASLWVQITGGRPYLDNPFEVAARRPEA